MHLSFIIFFHEYCLVLFDRELRSSFILPLALGTIFGAKIFLVKLQNTVLDFINLTIFFRPVFSKFIERNNFNMYSQK